MRIIFPGLKRDSTSPIPRVPDFPGLGLTFENEAGTRGIGTHFRKLAGIAGFRKWKNESRKHIFMVLSSDLNYFYKIQLSD